MTVRVLHISDTHGFGQNFFDAMKVDRNSYDIIVHSGDMLPNSSRNAEAEVQFQEQWLRQNIERWVGFVGDKTFLFCPGNHDFFDPVPMLRDAGTSAVNLAIGIATSHGMQFIGFPYVPHLCGEWMFERSPGALAYLTAEMAVRGLSCVLVAHCPPAGVLDSTGLERIGNPSLRALVHAGLFRFVLSGHVHEDAGLAKLGDTTVSNAACTWRIVEI